MNAASPEVCDVLIAGAGPTGLVLALELALRGVRVRIVDKNAGPGTASRAMVVHARTLEFYRRFGLASELISRGIKVEQVHIREGGREAAHFRVPEIGVGMSPFPFVLSFPQDEHEKVLGQTLGDAGVAIEWNSEIRGFVDHGDRVTATVRSGGKEHKVESAWLCGCDGAHSVVRDKLGIGFPGGTYDETFYVTDVEASGVGTDGDLNLCVGARIFCVVFPIRTTGRFRLIGIVPESLRGKAATSLADIQPFVEELVGIRITRECWFSTYQVHHRVADRFRSGRVFLAGDAGHVHSPAGGQGMNTGIGDAVNLAWKLAAVVQGHASASILETYEPERIAFARTLVATTDRAFTGVIDRNLRGRFLRKIAIPHIVPKLFALSWFRRLAFRVLSQVRIHYRGSALATGTAGRVRGGDRLPWMASVDNFAPLRSMDWQVHVIGTPAAPLAELCRTSRIPLHVFPWSDEASRAGFVRGGGYLIRPDAHVAVASARQDAREIGDFLRKFEILAG